MLLINTIGLLFSVFLGSVLIISNKFTQGKNLIAGVLLLVFAIPIFNSIRILNWGSGSFNTYELFSNFSLFLIGPLLYLYAKHWDSSQLKDKRDLLHFAPFFLLLFLQILSIKLMPNVSLAIEIVSCIILILSMGIYQFLSIRIIRKESKAAKKPLLYAVYGFAIVWHINLFIQLAEGLFDTVKAESQIYATLILSLLILLLAYSHWLELLKKAYPAKSKITLNAQRQKSVFNKIKIGINESKPYLDNNFSLQNFSILIGEPASYISYCINTQFKMSFPKYVAHLRIQEFLKKAHLPKFEHYTIEGLAKEVGFNSSSTFNKAFKENMNMLPSEFLKSLKRP